MIPPARFIDISIPIGPSPAEILPVNVIRWSHHEGGAHLAELAGVPQAALPCGLGWASERVDALTHSGTHMDAPFHYSPTCKGEPSKTIEDVPLEWCFGRGVKLDVRLNGTDDPVNLEEVKQAEIDANYPVSAGDIVLFHTGADRLHGTAEYSCAGRAISAEVVRSLCQRGVRVIGTDAWSVDASFPKMRELVGQHGHAAVWSAHYVGISEEFCVLERLTNLDALPAIGFWVACFPIKVSGGSAGWTRAVALIPL